MYEIIDEVARHGSFVRAAEALRLTPSAVSHAVSALEEELGFRLFNRGRGGVTLTDEGARMLEHVRAIRDRERLMQEEARQIRGLASGRVNIGTFSSVLVSWFLQLIALDICYEDGLSWELRIFGRRIKGSKPRKKRRPKQPPLYSHKNILSNLVV